MRISELLTAFANWMENPNNEALVLSENNEKCLEAVAEICANAAHILRLGAEEVEMLEPKQESMITPESITSLAEIAAAFDESGDEDLRKNASVIDELLLTIASPSDWAKQFKAAQNRRIQEIKSNLNDPYEAPHDMIMKDIRAEDTKEAIKDSLYGRPYRSMEHALSSRYCPDHPGSPMVRVEDGVWQCTLDKKMYNYQTGYTDERGNKIPGSSVGEQTHNLNHVVPALFDTRENRMGRFASLEDPTFEEESMTSDKPRDPEWEMLKDVLNSPEWKAVSHAKKLELLEKLKSDLAGHMAKKLTK